jgi:hypothetical protein
MASIQENADSARVAVSKGEDVLQAIKNAETTVGEARGIVSELLGDGTSDTLRDWLSYLNQVHSALIMAKHTIPLASDRGQQYVNNLLS